MPDGRTSGIRKYPLRYAPLGRLDPMLSHGCYRQLRQSDGTSSCVGLGWTDDTIINASAHPKSSRLKVNILPLQPKQLALTHPGGYRQYVQGMELVACSGV
jgi:hypothetical protein